MEDVDQIQKTNQAINKLYRQLGKEIYDSRIYGKKNSEKIESLIKKLNYNISKISKLRQQEKKVVLKPEINEDGTSFYVFCKECRAGNHPDSSHCIRCGRKLSTF